MTVIEECSGGSRGRGQGVYWEGKDERTMETGGDNEEGIGASRAEYKGGVQKQPCKKFMKIRTSQE